jgi:hypothetical protein
MSEIDHGLRDYSMLNDQEKLLATLATVEEPVSREDAIEFSGIDTTREDFEERAEQAFSTTGVIETEVGGEKRYILDEETKAELSKTIDLKSAQRVITDHLWKSWKSMSMED